MQSTSCTTEPSSRIGIGESVTCSTLSVHFGPAEASTVVIARSRICKYTLNAVIIKRATSCNRQSNHLSKTVRTILRERCEICLFPCPIWECHVGGLLKCNGTMTPKTDQSLTHSCQHARLCGGSHIKTGGLHIHQSWCGFKLHHAQASKWVGCSSVRSGKW